MIDENYLSDPAIVYLPMPGKVKAKESSKQLQPENVCYDVTAAMTDQTPADVPAVFLTGFQIEYKPGGRAVRLLDRAQPDAAKDGLAICYHNNYAYYKVASHDASGAVTNIIPVNANIGLGPYTQLTPYGSLKPK